MNGLKGQEVSFYEDMEVVIYSKYVLGINIWLCIEEERENDFLSYCNTK